MRKFVTLLATSVMSLVAGLAVASPAQATGSCSNSWICFWDTFSSASAVDKRDSTDTSPGECHSLPSTVTSYVTNRGPGTWYLYTGSFCNSFPIGTLYPETDGYIGSPWNNNSRSYKRRY